MRLKYELQACIDCVCFAANGELPEDRPNLADLIVTHLGANDARHLVCSYSDDNGHFSWSGCECCGSPLGGHRNTLAVLRCETPRELAQTKRRWREHVTRQAASQTTKGDCHV